MKKIPFLVLILSTSLLLGCESQDDTQVTDRARLEGKAQAEEQLKKDKELQDAQIKKDREVVDQRSREMEANLTARQDFFESHSGHFEGRMTNGGYTFRIRVSLFPNIPRYTDDRVRTPSEIEADLTNLAYNVQVVQWDPANEMPAVGCRVENLRPNLEKQTLNIISKDCPSSYFLVLHRASVNGTAQPSSNPSIFDVYAERKAKGRK